MERQIKKLDELMDGALTERFNQAMDEVMKNVADPNTDPRAKRQIKIVIDVVPNERRDTASFKTHVESKIAPKAAISNVVFIHVNDDGSISATEGTNQVPGQLAMDGSEQELPNVLQFNSQKKAQE